MNLATEISWAWRRARSPIRLVTVATIVLMPVAQQVAAAEAELPSLATPCLVAAFVGSGLLSLDRDRGILGLILARPITRSSYVLGRWSGVVALSAICLTVQLALSLVAAVSLSGEPLPNPGDVGTWLFLSLVSVSATSALLCLLATMLDGIGDACVLLGGTLVVLLSPELADRFGHYSEARFVAAHVLSVSYPQLTVGASLVSIATAAASGSLALVLAIFVVNGREIPSRGEG